MSLDSAQARWLPTLIALAALAGAGCGGGVNRAARQAHTYAAGDTAFRGGDFDVAIQDFRSLGSYRDAPSRLAQVRQAASATLQASARGKLADGHPRAAVALAQTAISTYGDTSSRATAFLHQAQRAQTIHHSVQQAQFRAHPELVHHHPPHYTGQPGDKTPPPSG
jgi:hypothetical protein